MRLGCFANIEPIESLEMSLRLTVQQLHRGAVFDVAAQEPEGEKKSLNRCEVLKRIYVPNSESQAMGK